MMKRAMLIDRLITLLMKRIRGKELTLAPGITSVEVLRHIFSKGFWPFFRGLLKRPFFGQSKGLIFIGRGCKILAPNKLRVGRSFYLGNYSYMDCFSLNGINVGDNVTIREGCWAQLTSRYDNPGTSITIGNSVYIGPRSILGAAAPLIIGDRCQIGANVSFIAENHDFEGEDDIFDQGVSRKGVTVGRDVWFGNNVTVLDGVNIGDGCVIGAGTVLTKSVPARSVVVGVPGRVIKTR
jgi:acetyltransferase-like isoleucine patch superfamily enzyme